MGDWTILIEGTGPHHSDSDADADAVFYGVVDLLRKRGQRISRATFTHGQRFEYPTSGTVNSERIKILEDKT
jgi:hypothetical protein